MSWSQTFLTHLFWHSVMIWLINGNNRNRACLCQWRARINKLLVDELSTGTKFVWQQIIRASPRLLGQPDTSNEYSCEGAQMPCVQGQRMEIFLQNGKFYPRQRWPEKNWRWRWVISETSASVSPSGQRDWPMVPAVVPTQRWGGAGGLYDILFVLGTKATVPSTSHTHTLREILKYWDFHKKKPQTKREWRAPRIQSVQLLKQEVGWSQTSGPYVDTKTSVTADFWLYQARVPSDPWLKLEDGGQVGFFMASKPALSFPLKNMLRFQHSVGWHMENAVGAP